MILRIEHCGTILFKKKITFEQKSAIEKLCGQDIEKTDFQNAVIKVCSYYKIEKKNLYTENQKRAIFNRDHATALSSIKFVEKNLMPEYYEIFKPQQ